MSHPTITIRITTSSLQPPPTSHPKARNTRLSANTTPSLLPPAPPPTTQASQPIRETCLRCALLSFRCSFMSHGDNTSGTEASCLRCLDSRQDICVHRERIAAEEEDEEEEEEEEDDRSDTLWRYYTPLRYTDAAAVAEKVSSLLSARRERDRFALPMPPPGGGRAGLKPLGERLALERMCMKRMRLAAGRGGDEDEDEDEEGKIEEKEERSLLEEFY